MIDKPPQIADAPGISWKRNKLGWKARWRARKDLIDQGWLPRSLRLWASSKDEREPGPVSVRYIQDKCNDMQGQMITWSRGGIPAAPQKYDGTLGGLIRCYQTDVDSTYHKVRFATRRYYKALCRQLEKDHGDEIIADIKARQAKHWHEAWTERGVAIAHSKVGMLRGLVNFGMTILEDDECARLSVILSKMKFPMAKPRTVQLTAAMADAIRAEAHRVGRHSIALAQAFQFDLMLRQKDVIGEWIPLSEPGISAVMDANNKWMRGIRWDEVSDDLILTHVTSKRQKEIVHDLKLAPMVMEELARLGERPKSGPIVVSEYTGRPWTGNEFSRKWREIATNAGVPKNVRNMDTRAGAITEATQAGADLEAIRHAATHSDIKMTMRYARGAEEKTATVARLRAEHRNKKGSA